ncbi:GTP-binding protein [Shewanella sp. KT0246]|uniref:CobW family GTP-binding protein n=1 Tax=Shewanella sp. KT0246 TaxID=2815912 RepID=UPI001BB9FEAF|nr:CobW family GTP-binding protein [Shewanella sp. KT0246]GIU53445.1 cobalamin biosynthesis protein CobW [Shewanella sp. KT0246]
MILKRINTNIITGFLGAGKTSLILSLLKLKPQNETWAVLVNEFGEIGIDAGLIGGVNTGDDIVIKEVAGGCLCCAAGIPTQVAINQLIQKAKPDRLFIEPTGLGHPAEILKVLTNEFNQQVLKVNQTVCVVDARKILDERYCENENFNQQLQIADIIYASKVDLYEQQELDDLKIFLEQFEPNKSLVSSTSVNAITNLFMALNESHTPVIRKTQPLGLIKKVSPQSTSIFHSNATTEPEKQIIEFNQLGYWLKANEGEGAYSIGWIFEPRLCFDFDALIKFINQLIEQDIVRLKAVMITEDGIAGFNMVDKKLSVSELDETMDSRIEIIALAPLDETKLTQQLLASFAIE